MLVTATNLAYATYAELWLRSMVTAGRVKASDICIMVFGTDAECRLLEAKLSLQARKLNVIRLNPADEQFAFLQLARSTRRGQHIGNIWFADYVRAWFGSQTKRYVWLDTDTLALQPLDELMALRHGSTSLWLAPETSQHRKRKYFETYLAAYRRMPVVHFDRHNKPITYNSGAIVATCDVSKQWRDGFRRVKKLVASQHREFGDLTRFADLGQMVWNFVAWRARGAVLDEKFNTLSMNPYDEAVVVHYHKQSKSKMIEDFVTRGFTVSAR